MIIGKIQSITKILNAGLLASTAWIVIFGGIYCLLSKSTLFLDWLQWILMAVAGILVVVTILFANRPVLNILWVASGLAIFPVWTLLLILHNGVWPTRWPERILHLIPSVGFLILFVTLLVVFGKALQARLEQS